MERPFTTLFLLQSVDGKISMGQPDTMDVDADFPKIAGVKEGLSQYYAIERTTDLWSLNSGRVQAKVGVNEKPFPPKCPVSFVVLDDSHLTEHGVRYFCALAQTFVLVTTNARHPAFAVSADNLHIVRQQEHDLPGLLQTLKQEYACDRITIQTGGTLNARFVREKLLDAIDLVVAPVLIGGKDTPTLVDGDSLTCAAQLGQLGVLRLVQCETLNHSYLRLRYQVVG